MNRRSFLRKTAAATGLSITAIAGCTSGNSGESPPRESEVFNEISMTDDGTIAVSLEDTAVVQTRASVPESDTSTNTTNDTQNSVSNKAGDVASSLSPVGVASAAKGRGGRGRSGGARGARSAGATGRNGRAKLGGGTGNTYVFWWNSHKDEVHERNAEITEVGIGRIADKETGGKDLPGPGKPESSWDRLVENPEGTVEFTPDETGWYRIGSHLKSPSGDYDYGWEAVDLLVTKDDSGALTVEQSWKVSPRL